VRREEKPIVKPLIYGYIQVTDESDDCHLRRTEEQLGRFAEAEGYRLGTIFHNYTPGRLDTFTVMIKALQRSEAHHVIVPSMRHLVASKVWCK
jgi:hypothetical protein